MPRSRTPATDGFVMPAESDRHDRCYMAWPCSPTTWFGHIEKARTSYAEVARAIRRFEPVTMLTPPSLVAEAERYLGPEIEIVEMDLDDSWVRDNGPFFVRSASGALAVVGFRFNGWGGRFVPCDRDTKVPGALADRLGLPLYLAPMVLEGGAISVDGEGTLLTTESCLLNPNRNPDRTREDIEGILRDYLGVQKVLWLRQGMHGSVVDGHIDGVAAFARPRTLLVAMAHDASDPNDAILRDNRERLETSTDAKGRSFEILELPVPKRRQLDGLRIAASYANFYIANGGIVAPTFGDSADDAAIAALRNAFPGREVVGVRGEYIGVGGGVIHCITQQQPATRLTAR